MQRLNKMKKINELTNSISSLSQRLKKETRSAIKTINSYDQYQKKRFLIELQKIISEREGISFSKALQQKHVFLNYVTRKLIKKENPSIEMMSKFISIFNEINKKL